MRLRPRLPPWALALLLAGPAGAEPPDESAFERAVQALRPTAQALGLQLRTDGLALAQWRAGLPLAATVQDGVCRIGYLPWLAARRFDWLFPGLPPAQQALWLEGLVAHELAHCAQGQAGAAAADTAPQDQERSADLAFAQHVLRPSGADGPALVERLARLRDAHAARDPTRDSGAALRRFVACAADGAEPACTSASLR